MLLAFLTLAAAAALTSFRHSALLLVATAVLLAYAVALFAVFAHEHKLGHADFDLHLHPR